MHSVFRFSPIIFVVVALFSSSASYAYNFGTATPLVSTSRYRIGNSCYHSTALCSSRSPNNVENVAKTQPDTQPPPQKQKALSSRLFQVCELCLEAIDSNNDKKNWQEDDDNSDDEYRLTVADIGCDHAQLAVGLLQNHIADHVIAIDRMKGPLDRGRQYARTAGVESDIDFRLGDGLEPLRTDDVVQVVCIAGVGARCIIDILQSTSGNDHSYLRHLGVKHLILQPVSPHPQYMIPLRRWLQENGWTIQNESIIKSRKRSYINLFATSKQHPASFLFNNNSNNKNNSKNLVLSSPIRRRVYSGESTQEEVELWTNYVNEYTKWAVSGIRSDTYDRDVGITRDEISSFFVTEEAALRGIII